MDVAPDKRHEVLLKLLEENRKQAEWLKDLDFKIAHSSWLVFLGVAAWLGTAARVPCYRLPFYAGIPFLAFLLIMFLLRNHERHRGLNEEYGRIVGALGLTGAILYSAEPICSARQGQDQPFEWGRGLYAGLIAVAAIAAVVVIALLPRPTC